MCSAFIDQFYQIYETCDKNFWQEWDSNARISNQNLSMAPLTARPSCLRWVHAPKPMTALRERLLVWGIIAFRERERRLSFRGHAQSIDRNFLLGIAFCDSDDALLVFDYRQNDYSVMVSKWHPKRCIQRAFSMTYSVESKFILDSNTLYRLVSE